MSPTLEERVASDLKRELETHALEARTRVQAVIALTEAEVASNKTDVVNKISSAFEALSKAENFALSANLPNPNVDDKRELNKKIQEMVDLHWAPAPLKDYFQAYDIFLNLKSQLKKGLYRAEGVFHLAYDNLANTMEAANILTGWPELTPKLDAAKTEIDAILDENIPEAVTDGIENPAQRITDSLSSLSFDALYNTDPALGPVVDIGTSKADLERLLSELATVVDRPAAADNSPNNQLSSGQVEQAQQLLDRLLDLEKTQRKQKTVIAQLLPLRLVVTEILDRNSQHRHEQFNEMSVEERRDVHQVGYYLRPQEPYQNYLGRDQAKLFLDLVGRSDIEWIEKTAVKLSQAEKKEGSLSAREVARLRELVDKIDRIYRDYFALVGTGKAIEFTDPVGWPIISQVSNIAEAYIQWINFILEDAGVKDSEEQAKKGLREPSLQDALEKWQEFFTGIARGRNGLAEMTTWAEKIMASFYTSAGAKESWKSELETRRFSGWKNALDTVAKEKREAGKTTEAAGYTYLRKKFDSQRKVTDGMIEYAQSRSMTADWHDEGMRKKLKVEPVSLRDFSTEDIDFFTDEYKYSRQFNEVRELMRLEMVNPKSDFASANGKWSNDNSSKNRLKAKMEGTLATFYPDISETDIAEIVDIAYNSMSFAGFGLDAFSEVHILGFSPNVTEITDRLKYYRIAPFVEYFYGAYKEPRFLVEMLGTYRPTDLIEKWKKAFPTEDYQQRINSIEWSIWASEEVYRELIPLRKEDNEPIGYNIETYGDGMLKWPYPSMYRFLFDPDIAKIRKAKPYTFGHWVDGYNAFVSFRELIYTDLSTKGKDSKEAIDFLMQKIGKVTDEISKLKSAQNLVDWNYIFVLVISFIDRMFISLHEAGHEDRASQNELLNRVSKLFGYQGDWKEQQLQKIAFAGSEGHVPAMIDQNKNNLNTAGEVDFDRLRPPDKQTKKPRKVKFLEAGKRSIRSFDGRDGIRNAERRKMKFHLSDVAGHNFAGRVVHFMEDRNMVGFQSRYPSFAGTIDILSSTVSEQAKPKGEAEKK